MLIKSQFYGKPKPKEDKYDKIDLYDNDSYTKLKVLPENKQKMLQQITDAHRTGRPEEQQMKNLVNKISPIPPELEGKIKDADDRIYWVLNVYVNDQQHFEERNRWLDTITNQLKTLEKLLSFSETEQEFDNTLRKILELIRPAIIYYNNEKAEGRVKDEF